MAWVEGYTNSREIVKKLAEVFCTTYKASDGSLLPGKNWELVYPNPDKYRILTRVTREVLMSTNYYAFTTAHGLLAGTPSVYRNGAVVNPAEYAVDQINGVVLFSELQKEKLPVTGEVPTTSDYITYQLANSDLVAGSVMVYRNGTVVDSVEYTVDHANGRVTFRAEQNPLATITADYQYYGAPYVITADYTYYDGVTAVTNELLATNDGFTYTLKHGQLSLTVSPTVYRNGVAVDPAEYVVDRLQGTVQFELLQSNVANEEVELTTEDYLVYTAPHAPFVWGQLVTVYRNGQEVGSSEYSVNTREGKVTFAVVQKEVVHVVNEVLTTTDHTVFATANSPIIAGTLVVYRNNQVVSTNEYTADLTTGLITFAAAQAPEDVITAYYSHYGNPYTITAAYGYYKQAIPVADEVATAVNSTTYQVANPYLAADSVTVKRDGVAVDPGEYTVNLDAGTITFAAAQTPGSLITVSYSYYSVLDRITADYEYYQSLIAVTGETLTAPTNQLYRAKNRPIDSASELTVYVDGTATQQTNYTVNWANGTVFFTTPLTETNEVTLDYSYYSSGLEEALKVITDRAVVKTTTTPVELTPEQIAQNKLVDERLNVTSLTMYVEFFKPTRLVNPEDSTEYYKDATGAYLRTDANEHFLQIRCFDRWDPVAEKPTETIKDASGNVVRYGAYVSEWAKLAWFRDWEEATVSQSGTYKPLLQQIKLPTMVTGVPIQFWLNINNDRAILFVLGEPTIDTRNYLLSNAYIGRIKPCPEGVNDTYGNFALTAGSSTVPARTGQPPTEIPAITSAVAETTGGGLRTGTYYPTYYGYILTYLTAGGESRPSAHKVTSLPANTELGKITLTFSLPKDAIGWRLYRCTYTGWLSSGYFSTLNNYKVLFASTNPAETTFVDDGSLQPGTDSPPPNGRALVGVVRDPVSNAILTVYYPTTYGTETGTGVTDIAMYRTRSGACFQKHNITLNTTDEFMTKVGFNPSRWTSKIHLTPVGVVHTFDGYRGTLDDVYAVDSTGLALGDELVVNKDTANEETYKYFPINAPYSVYTNSANCFVGLAVKTS